MISAELQGLLEPLERFEAIRRRAVRLGDRLADLSYANPYEGVPNPARAVLREALADERQLDLQYAPFGGQTLARRAVADALRESHALPFAFRDVVLTPGAMSALHVALRASGRPGDEVVIPVPCWLDYPLYARSMDLVPRFVPLAPDGFGLNADAIAEVIAPRTCAVVLSHPGNPTGRNHGRDELERLGTVLEEAETSRSRPITLIADETHRDFVEAGAYVSAAGHVDRSVIVYSFGKYHFMQGQRLGYAAVSPTHPNRTEVADELSRWTRIAGIATPTALMQRALPRLLALRHDHGWIAPARARLIEALRASAYQVTEPDGTLFVYVRTAPRFDDDYAFVEELASRGVLALPAPVFHHRGHFRVSLTGSERMLLQAAEVLGEMAGE
ncbi:MAG: aminotransferase class I/II-fold pyridoxal phosphate-dependent enzyme [Solirubrobacterales bacterium]